jgi:hypothetical protein
VPWTATPYAICMRISDSMLDSGRCLACPTRWGTWDVDGSFKVAVLTTRAQLQISRLALLSMMTVFKDILPGYKIRTLTDQELEVKVTKGVQKLRDFEMTLLKAFRAYLKLLRSIVTNTSTLSHGRCYPHEASMEPGNASFSACIRRVRQSY